MVIFLVFPVNTVATISLLFYLGPGPYGSDSLSTVDVCVFVGKLVGLITTEPFCSVVIESPNISAPSLALGSRGGLYTAVYSMPFSSNVTVLLVSIANLLAPLLSKLPSFCAGGSGTSQDGFVVTA